MCNSTWYWYKEIERTNFNLNVDFLAGYLNSKIVVQFLDNCFYSFYNRHTYNTTHLIHIRILFDFFWVKINIFFKWNSVACVIQTCVMRKKRISHIIVCMVRRWLTVQNIFFTNKENNRKPNDYWWELIKIICPLFYRWIFRCSLCMWHT